TRSSSSRTARFAATSIASTSGAGPGWPWARRASCSAGACSRARFGKGWRERSTSSSRSTPSSGSASRRRELDDEAGASGALGVELDVATARLDDPSTDRQTEARALPHLLGGHEGLEDARCHVCLHAGTVVLHRDPDALARSLGTHDDSWILHFRESISRLEKQVGHDLRESPR